MYFLCFCAGFALFVCNCIFFKYYHMINSYTDFVVAGLHSPPPPLSQYLAPSQKVFSAHIEKFAL